MITLKRFLVNGLPFLAEICSAYFFSPTPKKNYTIQNANRISFEKHRFRPWVCIEECYSIHKSLNYRLLNFPDTPTHNHIHTLVYTYRDIYTLQFFWIIKTSTYFLLI